MNTFSSYSYKKNEFLQAIAAFPATEQAHLKQALSLAEQFHAGQKRDEVDPENAGYVIHPVRAALWLLQTKQADVDMIIATLLHDTLEDTTLQPEQIEREFGIDVLRLVQAVTRPRPPNESEEEKLINKPTHLKTLLAADKRIRLVKTADWLDNIRSWPYMIPGHPSQQKFPRWINEVNNYYAPIAESVSPEAANEIREIIKKFQ
jgi:GTP diphosphokinase / guanosine-3',5'-bis(diphosphate) 3'-diphosphatase